MTLLITVRHTHAALLITPSLPDNTETRRLMTPLVTQYAYVSLLTAHDWQMAGAYLHVSAALLGEAIAPATGVQPVTIQLLQLNSQAWVLDLLAGQS